MRSTWVLLAALLVSAHAQDQTGELISNPGFDRDADGNGLPDHWNVSHDRVLWRETVFMGKNYELVSRPGAYVLATHDIALEKGKRYTITVRCRGEEGGIAGALILHGEEKPTREMALLWNLHPTAEYEDYTRTFEAPNPVARLYIYNIARPNGTVYYDRVSLREGEPDHLVITPLSLKPIDRPLTEPAETPHIDWASPLAGGPVRAFFTIRTFRCVRQLIELAQRIDLDYDVVHTDYKGDACVSDTARRATKRLDASFYEVYVIPSRIGEMITDEVTERVEEGAGLVIVEGFGRASRFLQADDLAEVDDAHPVRRGIPWDLMPEKILSSVQVGTLGEGRVVRLVFPMDVGRVWGLMPTENSKDAHKTRQFEYWEWWESLLAKAVLWAANREEDAGLRRLPSEAGAIAIEAQGAPTGAKIRVALRSARELRFDGPLLREPPREVALDGNGEATVRAPDHFPAGGIIADVSLLNAQGEVLAWASFVTTVPPSVRILALDADQEHYDADGVANLSLQLDVLAQAQVAVEGKLIDAFGRVVCEVRETRELPAGEAELTLQLPLRDPLCVHHKAFVRVIVDGREQDSDWVTILAPEVGPRRAAQDFLVTPWSPGMSHPIIRAEYAARTRELGFNAEFASVPYLMAEHGMPSGWYIGGGRAFRESEYSAGGVRPECLSDPAVVEEYSRRARDRAADHLPYGFYGVGIADEIFLSSRHKRHEMCFSEHCQARYRRWLQDQYDTIDALNAQWGTQYQAWDEIGGARTEDVRGADNFSPFVDFRTFMTDVWIDACKTITDAYHEVAPHTPVGHTNTFGANPFNGNDYWKVCTQVGFGWGQEYSEAIKGTGHKAIFDLWRSFAQTPEAQAARGDDPHAPPPFLNAGWIGYNHCVAAAHYEPWWLALHGSRGASYFAVNAIDTTRGISWALVYPTYSFTPYAMAVKEALDDLRGGCGKLLMEYERERPSVALLWSHPSMLVSWCESTADEPVPSERDGTDSYGSYFLSALNIRQHLNELQLDYVYVAPEQILTSDILRGYRVLFLPFTVAASEELVDRLEKYVQDGGVLVGDLRCLRTDEHGKPIAHSRHLTRLFGVERGEGGIDYGPGTIAFTQSAEGLDLGGRQIEAHGRESIRSTGAATLAAHAGGEPAVLVQRRGRGLSIYLNFRLPDYDVVARELFAQIMRRAGVQRPVIAEAVEGDAPPRCYERNTFTRGDIAVHGFIRDHRRCSDTNPVRFVFPTTAHVYDVRAKEYVGYVDRVEAAPAPGDTALYACLPYRVLGLDVSAPGAASPGDELRIRLSVRADAGEPGDHVLHVDLLDPEGRAAWHYARNILAPAGEAEIAIPLALNERPGRWVLRARDVLTGAAGEAAFTVAQ